MRVWVPVTAIACALLTSCVSPIYDTARTYPGLTVGGGVAYHDLSYTGGDIDLIMSGIRPDITIGYAPTNWFGVVGRAGVLLDLEHSDSATRSGFPFLGLGVKFSTPWERFNLGLRAEVDFPRYVSLTPMIGFCIPQKWEIVTVGLQTSYGVIPTTAFVSLHPLKGTHIFAGLGFPRRAENSRSSPEFSIGLGYTYTFARKNDAGSVD